MGRAKIFQVRNALLRAQWTPQLQRFGQSRSSSLPVGADPQFQSTVAAWLVLGHPTTLYVFDEASVELGFDNGHPIGFELGGAREELDPIVVSNRVAFPIHVPRLLNRHDKTEVQRVTTKLSGALGTARIVLGAFVFGQDPTESECQRDFMRQQTFFGCNTIAVSLSSLVFPTTFLCHRGILRESVLPRGHLFSSEGGVGGRERDASEAIRHQRAIHLALNIFLKHRGVFRPLQRSNTLFKYFLFSQKLAKEWIFFISPKRWGPVFLVLQEGAETPASQPDRSVRKLTPANGANGG